MQNLLVLLTGSLCASSFFFSILALVIFFGLAGAHPAFAQQKSSDPASAGIFADLKRPSGWHEVFESNIIHNRAGRPVKDISLSECIQTCEERKGCRSVDYQPVARLCELNSKTTREADPVWVQGHLCFNYYSKDPGEKTAFKTTGLRPSPAMTLDGWRGVRSAFIKGNAIGKPFKVSTHRACRKACSTNSQCKSFSVSGKPNGTCTLHSVSACEQGVDYEKVRRIWHYTRHNTLVEAQTAMRKGAPPGPAKAGKRVFVEAVKTPSRLLKPTPQQTMGAKSEKSGDHCPDDIKSADAKNLKLLRRQADESMRKASDSLEEVLEKLVGKEGSVSPHAPNATVFTLRSKDLQAMGIDGQIVVLERTMASLAKVNAESAYGKLLDRRSNVEGVLRNLNSDLVALAKRFENKKIDFEQFIKKQKTLINGITEQTKRLAEANSEIAEKRVDVDDDKYNPYSTKTLLSSQKKLAQLQAKRAVLVARIPELKKNARKWVVRHKCAQQREAKLKKEGQPSPAVSSRSIADIIARTKTALAQTWPGQIIKHKPIGSRTDRYNAKIVSGRRIYEIFVLVVDEQRREQSWETIKKASKDIKTDNTLDGQIIKVPGLSGAAVDVLQKEVLGYWSRGNFKGTNYVAAARAGILVCGRVGIRAKFLLSTGVTLKGHKYKYDNSKNPGSYSRNHPGYQPWRQLLPASKVEAARYAQNLIQALHKAGACSNSK